MLRQTRRFLTFGASRKTLYGPAVVLRQCIISTCGALALQTWRLPLCLQNKAGKPEQSALADTGVFCLKRADSVVSQHPPVGIDSASSAFVQPRQQDEICRIPGRFGESILYS